MKKVGKNLWNSTPQHIFVCAPKETLLCWWISLVQSRSLRLSPNDVGFFLKAYLFSLGFWLYSRDFTFQSHYFFSLCNFRKNITTSVQT